MGRTLIYKIVPRTDWEAAENDGVFNGAPVDLSDGFIHFSTAPQLAETARRHFCGQRGLVVVAFDADGFGERLKWEPSRGGDLFPHLYGALDPGCALWREPMPLDEEGVPMVPERIRVC